MEVIWSGKKPIKIEINCDKKKDLYHGDINN